MQVLIITGNSVLGMSWQNSLEKSGIQTIYVPNHHDAWGHLAHTKFNALIGCLDLPDQGLCSTANFATYRNPEIAIFPIASSTHIITRSEYNMLPNARICLHEGMSTSDLTNIVCYYTSLHKNVA